MTAKRIFDVSFALVLLIPGLPMLAALWCVIAWKDGRPALYTSERMKAPGQPFRLYKFRTMRKGSKEAESGVSGGDKAERITPLGRKLRRLRLDELPQLFNVLKGDMSFVGPRPPMREYVEMFPEIYGEVLKSKPGITGLATIIYHSHEEMLLRDTDSAEQTNAVYVARCIPRKAELDILYNARQSFCFDLYLIYLTAAKLMPLPGARVARLRAKAERV